jgi:hypothetical protein
MRLLVFYISLKIPLLRGYGTNLVLAYFKK